MKQKNHNSVNTIYTKLMETIFGHNTDISGFELSLRHINIMLKKKVLILGSGGVVSSIIIALKKWNHLKLY